MAKKQYSNEEALLNLQQSKEEGLRHFFNNYYASLSYYAFKLTKDEQVADELAAEAFVKLWQHRHSLSPDRSVLAWLYSIVRNSAFDHLRKVKRLNIKNLGFEYTEITEQDALHNLIRVETIRQIEKTLELLPPKCRKVFNLIFFHGKSYEEIAEELNISIHTVRNQKIRAIRLIREKMIIIFLIADIFIKAVNIKVVSIL